MKTTENYIVAIDGPAASGKGTVAKMLAKRLGIACLSTGCIYRGITVHFMDNGIGHFDYDKIEQAIAKLKFEIKPDAEGDSIVIINGKDVTDRLESVSTSANVAGYAKIPALRAWAKQIQKQIASQGSIVCEGRDIGSVVFPDAEYKFYLTASLKVRARRRYNQEIKAGEKVTLAQVHSGIAARDRMDTEREHSPLVRPEGSLLVDSSRLNAKQTVDRILHIIEKMHNRELKSKKPFVHKDFKKPFGATFFRRFLKIFVCIPYRILFMASVVNRRELRKHKGKPVIFAFQHRTNVDVVSIFLMFPTRKLHFIGKESLFKPKTFLNWFLRSLNGIPVRANNNLAVIRYSLETLKKGESMAIFPEGRRNFNAEDALNVRNGTAVIAMKAGLPVIPVVTNRAARPLRRNRFKLGTTIYPDQFSDKNQFSEALSKEMARILEGFECKKHLKKWERETVACARGITFVDGNMIVSPIVTVDEGELPRAAATRAFSGMGIEVTPVRNLYKIRIDGQMQSIYLCTHVNGESPSEELPQIVRDQITNDIKRYGIHLTRPTKYLK